MPRLEEGQSVCWRLTGLWRQADFVKLWAARAISLVGSGVTMLALPLTAVTVLEATPAQMGVLEAAGALPALLLGLFAGAWVDRRRRRPILIGADLGRAALLTLIPIAAILHRLCVEHLVVIAFALGMLNLSFGVAHGPFLLSLVGREKLVEGNSKLQMSRSVAELVGPGLAGALVAWVTAPLAIAVDVLSSLASGLLLGLIRAPEPAPDPLTQQQSVWRQIGDGLRLVANDRTLRAIAGCIGTLGLFNSILEAIFILYVTRELEIGPGLLGLIFAVSSVGFLIGALLPGWASRRFGLGPSIIGGILLAALSDLLIPLAGGTVPLVVTILVMSSGFFGLGLTVFNVGQASLQQAVTPNYLQGRVNATMGVIGSASGPLGGLLGGTLGTILGLRTTLALAAVGEILSVAWLLSSPLRSLREQPEAGKY
jgi:MFS family permease